MDLRNITKNIRRDYRSDIIAKWTKTGLLDLPSYLVYDIAITLDEYHSEILHDPTLLPLKVRKRGNS